MRFLKNKIVNVEEFTCIPQNLYDTFSRFSQSGSDIFFITTEQYEKLKSMTPQEAMRALLSYNSEYENHRIGLFNSDLVGSPLVLLKKESEENNRSFSFIFKNNDKKITSNDCEVIDNYPDIFHTRDIAKYHNDNPIYTDTPVSEFIRQMIDQSKNFYYVNYHGYLFYNTPNQYEMIENMQDNITKGKQPKRRITITKDQTIQMLDEMLTVPNM